MKDEFQPRLMRLKMDLHARLRDVRDARKAFIQVLRASREVFGAREAAIATLNTKRTGAELIYTIPQTARWDDELLTGYINGSRPHIPQDTLLAPIQWRRRNWAVLALRCPGAAFTPEHRKALFWITEDLTDILESIDRKRTRKVRISIERKIADHEDPKDLMYDILHGLRSLTGYDHSASLFISPDGSAPLELVAEQIAWTKARSRRIGLRLDLDEETSRQLRAGAVSIHERQGIGWQYPWRDPISPLQRLLALDPSQSQVVPPEVSMLHTPISTPDGTLGVLKLSAQRRGVLGDYEAELVEEFMPLASLAIQFSVRTENLRKQMLRSERKHMLADLARGIAHDVNNALGAILPLVQQLRDDARSERLSAATLSEDLEYIEGSIRTCRRIFGGILSIARGSSHVVGHGNLRRAIEDALSVLADSMKKRAIDVILTFPDELPTLRGGQGDLTQLFLNICTNARDAMPEGGELKINVVAEDGAVRVTIQDTGCGIPRTVRDRIMEPFVTTKTDGSGLGLAICRSIVWDIGGEMNIESEEGKGTSVILRLPVLEEPAKERENETCAYTDSR